MAYRRTAFAPDEYYHCYTRGTDHRITFENAQDYGRFQEYLYLCNDIEQFDRSDFLKWSHSDIFLRPRKRELVAIASYALMSNHFHIVFREIEEGGSSKFLQKLGTSYVMYFNAKNKRVGSLFIRPCRSRHINSDRYLKYVTQYIHLNAAEIFESGWKKGSVKNMNKLESELKAYRYSSLMDFIGSSRPERAILNIDTVNFIKDGMPPITSLLADAREYYANIDDF